jgi:hypothetical protein
VIILPVRFEKRSLTLQFGTSQEEIVRKTVRDTFDTKKAVFYREVALNRVDVVSHVHPAEIPESRVAKKQIKNECSAERQKQGGNVPDRLSVEQTNRK